MILKTRDRNTQVVWDKSYFPFRLWLEVNCLSKWMFSWETNFPLGRGGIYGQLGPQPPSCLHSKYRWGIARAMWFFLGLPRLSEPRLSGQFFCVVTVFIMTPIYLSVIWHHGICVGNDQRCRAVLQSYDNGKWLNTWLEQNNSSFQLELPGTGWPGNLHQPPLRRSLAWKFAADYFTFPLIDLAGGPNIDFAAHNAMHHNPF